MPELYGKPFKWKLYRQVRELQSASVETSNELRQLRRALKFAAIRNDELEAKIKRMQERAQGPSMKATKTLGLP
jgi:hypothetical protein